MASGKVSRVEKIGSGHYTKLTKNNLDSSYPHLDARSEARQTVAFQSMQIFYKNLSAERKKEWDKQLANDRASATAVEYWNLDTIARE